MKNLLIALAILPLFATGHGYKPFINTESRWIIGALFEKRYVNQEQEVENEATTNQLLFFYDGDSIVENSSYHKIMFTCGIKTERIRDWEGFLISENESWAPCDTQLFALIREDTTLRKVFVVESSVQFLDSCNRLLSNSFFVRLFNNFTHLLCRAFSKATEPEMSLSKESCNSAQRSS